MKALVVFVEGAADAHYVMRSLGQLSGAQLDNRKPVDLPTPFGASPGPGRVVRRDTGLILRWHDRAPLDRSLAASAEGHEPVFHGVVRVPEPEMMVVLVRMGGDRKAAVVHELLQRLAEAMTPGLRHDVAQVTVAFIFDADSPEHYQQTTGDCVDLRAQRFIAEYPRWLGSDALSHGCWVQGRPFPCGLFVLHGPARSGTLETVVEPALAQDPLWHPRLKAADQLLVAHALDTDSVNQKESDRAKARITIAGQFIKPGESLAQIMKRGEPRLLPCVPNSVFSCSEAQALVTFLGQAPWT